MKFVDTVRSRIISAGILLSWAMPAAAAIGYQQIDYPSATSTELRRISDTGWIIGRYVIGDTREDFYRSPDGQFHTIRPDGATDVWMAAISNDGTVVGSFRGPDQLTTCFVKDSAGKVTTISLSRPWYETTCTGVNNLGEISGVAVFDGSTMGFVRRLNDDLQETSAMTAINDKGQAVGVYHIDKIDENIWRGAILARDGTFTYFDAPRGTQYMGAVAIDENGDVSGEVITCCGRMGFVRKSDRTFEIFDAGNVGTNQVNDFAKGKAVGRGLFDNIDYRPFVRLHHGRIKYIDYPGATDTFMGGINERGVIVGSFRDAAGVLHGFIRTPHAGNAE